MSAFTKTLIGFAAIFLVLLLFTGPAAPVLVAASIICTAGIGLVVWIPLSYGVGSLIVAIYQSISNNSKSSGGIESSTSSQTTNLTNDQRAIINYILLARGRGFKDDDTFTNLKVNGWSEQMIRECFARIESKTY